MIQKACLIQPGLQSLPVSNASRFSGYEAGYYDHIAIQHDAQNNSNHHIQELSEHLATISPYTQIHATNPAHNQLSRAIPKWMRGYTPLWLQDKVIVVPGKTPNSLNVNWRLGEYYKPALNLAKTLAAHGYHVTLREMNSRLDGGNMFYFPQQPKRPKPFAMIGSQVIVDNVKYRQRIPKQLLQKKTWFTYRNLSYDLLKPEENQNLGHLKDDLLTEIANDLNLPKSDVHVIPQPYFHLDMWVRPLTYPDTVLVNDPDMVIDLLKSLKNSPNRLSRNELDLDRLIRDNENFKQFAAATYHPVEETIEGLKKLGFKKIVRVPGVIVRFNPEVFDSGAPMERQYPCLANFMNAIVTTDTDGKLHYLTNQSGLDLTIKDKYQANPLNWINTHFEQVLKEQVTEIRSVSFIGGSSHPGPERNYISHKLNNSLGGLHCMVSEVPHFSTWPLPPTVSLQSDAYTKPSPNGSLHIIA